MRGIREQRRSLQVLRERPFAPGDRRSRVELVETVCTPHVLGHLHDARARTLVEAVSVRLHPPMLGLFEHEGEGVEAPRCAEPDEPAKAGIGLWPECLTESRTRARVDAVGGHHDIRAMFTCQ